VPHGAIGRTPRRLAALGRACDGTPHRRKGQRRAPAPGGRPGAAGPDGLSLNASRAVRSSTVGGARPQSAPLWTTRRPGDAPQAAAGVDMAPRDKPPACAMCLVAGLPLRQAPSRRSGTGRRPGKR